ncbi:Predicted amidophosphoribosyltransferases [Paraoerskovia marina]|uniref:Predicted amidophosphoribosyltransferases n=1 Tax=Paraoerskovia marina TaxID=545619 RepID=A0A1H1QYJ7_9CELL|nr:phosphoribosyltransferase family protein [Paraoerskovia marina]SDS28537.1 Predicted amidophosphoribosyltransferases [Paraoerskovia marina]
MTLSALARLVVPVSCPGCGLEDVRWCDRCLAPLRAELSPRHDVARMDRLDGRPVPVLAVADYAGPVRDVVVAWKDRARADLSDPLTRSLRRAVALAAGELAPPDRPLVVVPVPSSRASTRARGWSPVGDLADAVAVGLRRAGVPTATSDLLHVAGRSTDQVGLGLRARATNRATSTRVRAHAARRLPTGQECLLVDDVVTTGATLATCVDALREHGLRPHAAIALVATPAPGFHAIPSSPRSVEVSRHDPAG